jgi:hypothetical protein
VGLGLDELSMPAAAIPRAKRIIRACNATEAVGFAEDLLRLPTVAQTEEAVREMMIPRFVQDIEEERTWAVDRQQGSGSYPAVPGPDLPTSSPGGPGSGKGKAQ